jgi:hypothetical protein
MFTFLSRGYYRIVLGLDSVTQSTLASPSREIRVESEGMAARAFLSLWNRLEEAMGCPARYADEAAQDRIREIPTPMAAAHSVPHSRAIRKSGVLSGCGIRVRVNADHLLANDITKTLRATPTDASDPMVAKRC